jgi:hypothetical protein
MDVYYCEQKIGAAIKMMWQRLQAATVVASPPFRATLLHTPTINCSSTAAPAFLQLEARVLLAKHVPATSSGATTLHCNTLARGHYVWA